MKLYQRTENGVTSTVSKRDGLNEINHAQMAGRRHVQTMSSINQTDFTIEYKDGRSVRLVLVEAPSQETDSKGRKIITVNGKRYIVDTITPARPKAEGATSWIPEAFVSYSSERNGETFGATRHGRASQNPGTVGRAVWDAVNRTDIAHQVSITLGDHADDYDIDGIVDDLVTAHDGEIASVDDFDSESYWAIIETHDTTPRESSRKY